MMKPLIAVIDAGYASYAYERDVFERAGYTFKIFEGEHHDVEGKIAFAKDAQGILVRWTEMTDQTYRQFLQLKAIIRYGVGYDNVDIAAAQRLGLRVANVQSYANHSVSDHALALLLSCTRCLPMRSCTLKHGFGKPPVTEVFEMADRTLGIIGLGRIGSTFCIKARGLFKRVLAVDPYVPLEQFERFGAEACDLSTLFAESHAISLHCNLTEETTDVINARALGKMKQQPILVNTARGPMIDAHALVDALNKGTVHSAGLDVFPEEPPGPVLHELMSHPHVIATGHYAWYSTRSAIELQKRATHNMIGLLTGQPVEDELTRSNS
jgi:D-3-phosphoglycerate dehydrogenase / 2-oxoglutarate reductase